MKNKSIPKTEKRERFKRQVNKLFNESEKLIVIGIDEKGNSTALFHEVELAERIRYLQGHINNSDGQLSFLETSKE